MRLLVPDVFLLEGVRLANVYLYLDKLEQGHSPAFSYNGGLWPA